MDIGDLLPVGITLVIVSVALAFGMQVTGEIKTGMCEDSLEHETSGQCYTCPNSTFNTWNSTGLTCDNTTGGDPRSYVTLGGVDYNASENGIDGMSKLTGKLPTIGLVVAAVIIIAILVKGFGGAAQ